MRTRKALGPDTDPILGGCGTAGPWGAVQRGRDLRGLAERDQVSRKEKGRGGWEQGGPSWPESSESRAAAWLCRWHPLHFTRANVGERQSRGQLR